MSMNHFRSEESARTDEQLCRAAAGGDSDAMEALVLRYHYLVRSCARPLFLMGADQEDLIQEGMVGLLNAIREYRPERGAAFRTFAEHCIRSRMRSAIRSAAGDRHAALNFSVSLEESGEASEAYEDGPEARVIGREDVRELFERLDRMLTPLERQVLPLYLRGLSYQEMSEALHRTRKSIDNALRRIRRKLEQLAPPEGC